MFHRYLFPGLFFIISVLFLCPPYSYASSTKLLEQQITDIKKAHEVQAVNLANALNRLQEVLSAIQSLNGRVEESLYNVREQNKLVDDSQRRLEIMEDKIQSLLTQLEELKAVGLVPKEQSSVLKEFESYDNGLSELNALEFKKAIQSFNSFISNHPQSRFADDALYWIGESYFSLRDFPAAVSQFQKVIKKYPESQKIPSSLLKQGLSFYEMQSFADAKAFLSKLSSQYPNSKEAIRALEKIKNINRLMELREKEAVEKRETL